MDKGEALNKVADYMRLLSDHFNLDKVVMYGSYANGHQREDSDIDVAVIVNSIDVGFFEYAPLLWKLRMQVDDRIEPILIDKQHDQGDFLNAVLSSGIVVE